jgi:glycosyltransferase involved in cell wall biosynthesis
MHVIQIITEPTGGGAEFLARTINSNLPKYGIKGSILFLKNPHNIYLLENEYSLNLNNDRSMLSIYKLWKFISKFEAHNLILHGHLVTSMYLLALPYLFRKYRIFFTEHSTNNKRRSIIFMKFFERLIYSRFEKIVCISAGVMKSLNNYLASDDLLNKTIVIHNGARFFNIDYEKKFSSKTIRFLSVGSLKKEKGFATAINAFSHLKHLNFHYTIVGEGPERANLEGLVRSCGLEDKVRLVGAAEDMAFWYWSHDVQIIPSVWEGFGLVAVEAMSAGMPLIVTNIDGLREIASSAKFTKFFTPNNEWELQKAIIELCGERRLFRSYHLEAIKCANKFSIDKMMINYRKLYLDGFSDFSCGVVVEENLNNLYKC